MLPTHKALLVLLFLTSCVGCTSYDSEITSTPNAITPTDLSPTLIPLVIPPSATVNAGSQTPVLHSCISSAADPIPLQSIASGTVLVEYPRSSNTPNHTSLLELGTNQIYELPAEADTKNVFVYVVSPDGDKLAYIEFKKDNTGQSIGDILWVVNAHAERIAKMTFPRIDLHYSRWLDDEHLLFTTDNTPMDGSVLLVDPFTQEQTEISRELPDLIDSFPRVDLFWRVEYSSGFEWGLYVTNGMIDGQVTENGNIVVLRDFFTGQTVWRSNASAGGFIVPEWSPTGREIAYLDGDQLLILNRSGEIEAVPFTKTIHPQLYSWSPDGQYLAFWHDHNLMFYDYINKEVSDFCYQSQYDPTWIDWFPGGHKLVIEVKYGKGGTLVDIDAKLAFLIQGVPQAYYPRVWMNSMP